ncbi:hypothetical protein BH10BDE1_BH10BDE1_07440 [soil metagenome]
MTLALAGGAFLALRESRVFAIRAIPLEWNGRLDHGRMETEIARDIEAGIGVRFSNVMGKRPWEIDLEGLGRSIRDLPWISDARIQRVFPDRLVVSIVPKKPLAVIVVMNKQTRQGSLRPITQDGELMPEWTSNVVPDVPFLRGEGFLKDPALRERTVALIRALPAEGVLARANLAEISWVAPEVRGEARRELRSSERGKSAGFSILLLSPRTEIRLGDSEIETKLVRVAHVLNYLSTQGKKAPVIDSTSVKKVVVRAHHRP